MAEYLDITGRIRTTSSDTNVVETQEVFDNTKQQKQSAINSDFESRIAALHAQDYLYYDATSDDTSIATILPLTGTTGKIYRIANWNANATGVDPDTYYNIAYYSEYAWDANASTPAYTLLSVSASGITDIPTENDSRLITSRGVKSAIDNVAFSTNEKVNIIGIDKTHLLNPTNNSVAKADDLINLNQKLASIDLKDIKVVSIEDWHPEGEQSGYYQKSGVWANLGQYATSTRIDVSEADAVRFLGVTLSSSSQLGITYSFLDKNGTFLDGYPKEYDTGQVNVKEYLIKIPAAAKYLVLCKTVAPILNLDDFYVFLRSGTEVNELLNNSLKEVGQELTYSLVSGLLKNNGTISSVSGYSHKEINIPEDCTIIYLNGQTAYDNNYSVYWFLDDSENPYNIISYEPCAGPLSPIVHDYDYIKVPRGATRLFVASTISCYLLGGVHSTLGTLRYLKNNASELAEHKDDIQKSLFNTELSLSSTSTGLLKEDGSIQTGSYTIKKFDIPIGTKKLFFSGYTNQYGSSNSVYWIVKSGSSTYVPDINSTKYHKGSDNTATYNELEIDLSLLSQDTNYQIWVGLVNSLVIKYYDYSQRINERVSALEDGIGILGDKSTQILDSLFYCKSYPNSDISLTGLLKENGTIETSNSIIRKIDIPQGVTKIFFNANTWLSRSYSVCWVVDSQGNKLVSISGTGVQTQFVDTPIDLTNLSEIPVQIWSASSDFYIRYYDYSLRLEKKFEVGVIDNNQWRNKRILWLGTSIPRGQSAESGGRASNPYPYQVCTALGATLIDRTSGGLSQQCNKDVQTGIFTPKSYGSTSIKISECIGDYTSFKSLSYENTLLNQNADLYIFDVEPNNQADGSAADLALFDWYNWKYSDNSTFESHRDTYIGALIFEIDALLTEKPDAVIVFIGEYIPFNSNNQYEIREQTISLCEKFHIYYIDIAKKLGYNGKNISTWVNGDKVHPKQITYDRMAKMLINELLLIA